MTPARRSLSRPFLPLRGIASPRPIRRLTHAVGFWLLSMVVCVLAHAAEAIKKSFDLPADSIERSLKRFSAQSGLEVLFPTDTVAGVRTVAVRGEMTSRQALDALLSGTGFGAFQDPKSGALTVKKHPRSDGLRPAPPTKGVPDAQNKTTNTAPSSAGVFARVAAVIGLITATPAETTAAPAIEMSPFVVASDNSGYAATNALTGTFFRTDLLTLPKQVDVVTSEFMSDIGAKSLNEAMTYVAGMPQELPANVSATDTGFRYRGFAHTNVYRNGFRALGAIDAIMIDRLEITKGPSSTFGGTISPGGLINQITRKPTSTPFATISQTIGRYELYRTEVEAGGPVPLLDGRLRYRIGAAYETAESFRDFEYSDKTVVTAALDYKLFAKTTLSAEYSYIRRHVVPPVFPPLILAANAAAGIPVPRYLPVSRFSSFNPAGPEVYRDNSHGQAQLALEHKFDRHFTFRAQGFMGNSFFDEKNSGANTSVVTNATTGARTINSRAGANFLGSQANRDQQLQLMLLGEFGDIRDVRYRTNLIADRYLETAGLYRYRNPGIPVLDLRAPNFLLGPDSAFTVPQLGFDLVVSFNALTSMHQVELLGGRLTLLGGIRRDVGYSKQWVRTANNTLNYIEHGWNTHSGGISFKVLPGLVAYASYGESFQPQAGATFGGRLFEPTTGIGTDLGIKLNLWDGRISGNISVFDTEQQGLLRNDPDHPGFRVQSGLEGTTGVEGGLLVSLVKNWQMQITYANIDSRTKNSDNPILVGARSVNTPKHSGAVWSKYSFSEGRLKGFKFGVGAFYVSDRSAGGADPMELRLPSYNKFDLMLGYDTAAFSKKTTFMLHVHNLTEREYFISTAARSSPRTFSTTARMRF